jgi:hypothetical protein
MTIWKPVANRSQSINQILTKTNLLASNLTANLYEKFSLGKSIYTLKPPPALADAGPALA